MPISPLSQNPSLYQPTPSDYSLSRATALLERHVPHLHPPLRVHRRQKVYWPDASLGDPHFLYLIPPSLQEGELLVLRDALDQCFQFHANADNGHIILYPMTYRANVIFKTDPHGPWQDLIPSDMDTYADQRLGGVKLSPEISPEHLRFYLRRAACFLKDLFSDPLDEWVPASLEPRRKLDSLDDLGTCTPHLSLDFIHPPTHRRRRVVFDVCQRVRYVKEGKVLYPDPRPPAQAV